MTRRLLRADANSAWELCVHEAAHAVVAAAVGADVRQVIALDIVSGSVSIRLPDCRMIEQCAVYMAGRIADEVVLGLRRATAEQRAAGDYERMARFLLGAGRQEEAVIRREGWKLSAQIVESERWAIGLIADALMKKGLLQGRDLEGLTMRVGRVRPNRLRECYLKLKQETRNEDVA